MTLLRLGEITNSGNVLGILFQNIPMLGLLFGGQFRQVTLENVVQFSGCLFWLSGVWLLLLRFGTKEGHNSGIEANNSRWHGNLLEASNPFPCCRTAYTHYLQQSSPRGTKVPKAVVLARTE